MRWLANGPQDTKIVAGIISAAGGKVVGRTRLQKMFFLISVSGFENHFKFEYRHYGPYSEELMRATAMACTEGLLREDEYAATWGGTYSIFSVPSPAAQSSDHRLQSLLALANRANAIDLELAATAVFLAQEGSRKPWQDTQDLKPDKAKRLQTAKELLTELRGLDLPNPLPVFD